MGSKLVLWQKAGRFFTAVVVLCFFLPFFGISCNGMEVVKVSGADMVGGCKPGGMINELDDKMGELGGSTYGGGMPGVDREPFAIAAMALALAGFGLAWSRRRQALQAGAVVAVLGIASLVGLWVVMNDKLSDTSELSKKAGGGGGDMDFGDEMAKDVKVDSGARMGFWLTLLGFAGIAALTIAALREKEGAVGPHSAGYPPPPPPPDGYPPPS
jgi:hypothetical protein